MQEGAEVGPDVPRGIGCCLSAMGTPLAVTDLIRHSSCSRAGRSVAEQESNLA
jgi:hypothetical protein